MVKMMLKYVKTNNISKTNNVINGVKVKRRIYTNTSKRGKNQESWWKRTIMGDIKKIQGEISILEKKQRGEIRPDRKYSRLKKK